MDERQTSGNASPGYADPYPQRMSAFRVRVSRACDRCKKRKIRCTGSQPCTICIQAAAPCVYAAPYNRGKRHRDRGTRVTESDTAVNGVQEPGDDNDLDNLAHINSSGEPPSRESPGPPVQDLQGHYVGPASGVSFLVRIHNRLQSSVSSSAHDEGHKFESFTFGDAPLPELDLTFCSVMISREETINLLNRYFDFTVPVDRFLHRPTLELWLQEFHETMAAMQNTPDAPARRAILWMIFAMAQEHMIVDPSNKAEDKSIRYFLAADYQLSKERGSISLVSVQARLCQCLWLLSQSRMNHCWEVFGTAARLAIALGLHRRNRRSSRPGGPNVVEIECCRRTFWNAYCLDNYLSIAMGRPRIFHDDDIDQKFPSCIDDSDLQMTPVQAQSRMGNSAMVAPVAYFKLSRIVSMILHDIYSIRPLSTSDRYVFATKYSTMLAAWRAELPQFLDADNGNTGPLIPIFQRQRNVLSLAYWHTIILINRPFLLSSLSRVGQTGRRHRQERSGGGPGAVQVAQIEDSIQECLRAAMHIADTVNELVETQLMYKSFWFTSNFAFSAVVVLYAYVIQRSHAPSYTATYLAAATRCQEQLFSISSSESLVARFCVILEELRSEVVRLSRLESSTGPEQRSDDRDTNINVSADFGNGGVPAPMMVQGMQGILDPESAPVTFSELIAAVDPEAVAKFYDESPGSSMVDVTSWMQFESLAVPCSGDVYSSFQL